MVFWGVLIGIVVAFVVWFLYCTSINFQRARHALLLVAIGVFFGFLAAYGTTSSKSYFAWEVIGACFAIYVNSLQMTVQRLRAEAEKANTPALDSSKKL